MTPARRADDLAPKTDSAQFGGGRARGRGHYTAAGIRRVLCSRAGCGRRADTEWSACADRNAARPLCAECDYALNAVALAWWGDPAWQDKLDAYRPRLEDIAGRPLDSFAVLAAQAAAQRISARR